MAEKPFFFRNGEHRLFGVMHEPAGAAKHGLGFVFCSPFAEEKLWAHRVFVSFARELACLGYPVLRFDYMGTGDSDGDFEQSTAATNISDIKAAAGHMLGEGKAASVCLLGLNLGATFAAVAAEQAQGVEALVLWNPVIKAGAYMQEVLKMNLTTQLAVYKEIRLTRADLVRRMEEGATVNVDGYEMSRGFYEEASAIDLSAGPRAFAGRVLIAEINRRGGEPGKAFSGLASMYADCAVAAVREEPFWKEIKSYCPKAENLFAATLGWLGKGGHGR